jgi:hypothetical protein
LRVDTGRVAKARTKGKKGRKRESKTQAMVSSAGQSSEMQAAKMRGVLITFLSLCMCLFASQRSTRITDIYWRHEYMHLRPELADYSWRQHLVLQKGCRLTKRERNFSDFCTRSCAAGAAAGERGVQVYQNKARKSVEQGRGNHSSG